MFLDFFLEKRRIHYRKVEVTWPLIEQGPKRPTGGSVHGRTLTSIVEKGNPTARASVVGD